MQQGSPHEYFYGIAVWHALGRVYDHIMDTTSKKINTNLEGMGGHYAQGYAREDH